MGFLGQKRELRQGDRGEKGLLLLMAEEGEACFPMRKPAQPSDPRPQPPHVGPEGALFVGELVRNEERQKRCLCKWFPRTQQHQVQSYSLRNPVWQTWLVPPVSSTPAHPPHLDDTDRIGLGPVAAWPIRVLG